MNCTHVCEEELKASQVEKWACVELYEITDNKRKRDFVMVPTIQQS